MDNKEAKEIVSDITNNLVKALNKQIPKKPKYIGGIPGCSCGMNLSKEEYPFCRYCGQRIDWSEEEK